MNRRLRLIISSLLSMALVGILLLPAEADAQSRERTQGRKKTERVEKRSPSKTARNEKNTPRQRATPRTNGRTSSRTSRATNPRRTQDARRDRTVTRERTTSRERTVNRGRTTSRDVRTTNRDRNTRTSPSNRTVRSRDNNRTGTSRTRTERSRSVQDRSVRTRDSRDRNARDRSVRTRDNRDRNAGNRTVRDRDSRDRTVTSNGRVRIDDRRTRNDRRDRDRYDRDRRDRDRYDRDRGHRRVLPKKHWKRDNRWGHYRGGKKFRSRRAGIFIHVPPRRKVRPIIHVDIDIAWPWVHRHRYGWAPRYEYRQVVYVDVGWGQRHRDSRIDVRTVYRHRVRRATPYYAEVDVYIDRLELYEDGYFIGEVDRIPPHLSRIRATIHRNGRIDFDRSVFLVGDPYVGFEMISTPHYGRYVLGGYWGRDYRVGVLDLYEGRVVQARYSRLYDPHDFDGFVPISLLPDDHGWLWDYGPEAVSSYRYEDDYDDEGYYYGYDGRDRYDTPSYNRRGVRPQVLPQTQPHGRPGLQTAAYAAPVLQREERSEVSLELGARVALNRTVEIRRIE